MVFNVTETIVCEVINLMGILFFKCLMAVYRTMEVEDGELGSKIPHAVGAIDRTWHKIERPNVIPQRPLYSGHRHFH